jgi:hypothetical protein
LPARCRLQELRCAEVDDEGGLNHSLSSHALHRVLADDDAQLDAAGIEDDHQVYLHTAGTAGGDLAADMRRTMSSGLRERVSRSFTMHDVAEALAPSPEGE